MKYKLLAFSMAVLALSAFSLPSAQAKEPQNNGAETSAKAWLLMERETGTVLCADHEHDPLEPASVTKIMTMLLTVEAIDSGTLSLDDVATTSEYASGMGGSQVFLKEGEQMTIRDLLKAVAVASGNDAAVVLAEHLAGSESAFVERMNQRAKELGMKDTTFRNCNGLPAEGHVTTAYDIALMSRELLSHDIIRDYVGIWMDTIRGGSFQLANTNKLIYYYEGATGLKTGSTGSAGFCVSASAMRDGMELIAVVLGSETSEKRFTSAKNLLNYGFGAYTMTDAAPAEPLPTVAVELGEASSVRAALDGDCRLLISKEDADKVEARFEVPEKLTAPVAAGDELGKLIVTVDGETVKTVSLIASESVQRLGFSGILSQLFRGAACQ